MQASTLVAKSFTSKSRSAQGHDRAFAEEKKGGLR